MSGHGVPRNKPDLIGNQQRSWYRNTIRYSLKNPTFANVNKKDVMR